MRKILIILLVLLVGCRSSRIPQVSERVDSVYIEKEILIPHYLPPDSATIRALLECDENGKVVLKWLDAANSKNMQLKLSLDSLGNLYAKAKNNPDTVYLPSKEIIVYRDREVEKIVPVERKLTKWQKFKMNMGGVAIGAILFVVAFGIWKVIGRVRKRK